LASNASALVPNVIASTESLCCHQRPPKSPVFDMLGHILDSLIT